VQVARAVHVAFHHAHGPDAPCRRTCCRLRTAVTSSPPTGSFWSPLAITHARGGTAGGSRWVRRGRLVRCADCRRPCPQLPQGSRHAEQAGWSPLGAQASVRRAVLHPAGLADARRALARRLLVYAAAGDAVIGAESLRRTQKQRQPVPGVTCTVLVFAHDQLCRCLPQCRARHRATAPFPQVGRCAAAWPRRPCADSKLPLDALHQHPKLDELGGCTIASLDDGAPLAVRRRAGR